MLLLFSEAALNGSWRAAEPPWRAEPPSPVLGRSAVSGVLVDGGKASLARPWALLEPPSLVRARCAVCGVSVDMDEDEVAPRATTLRLFVLFHFSWSSPHVVHRRQGQPESALHCSCEQAYVAALLQSSHVAQSAHSPAVIPPPTTYVSAGLMFGMIALGPGLLKERLASYDLRTQTSLGCV